jgi:hypothetical protein
VSFKKKYCYNIRKYHKRSYNEGKLMSVKTGFFLNRLGSDIGKTDWQGS